MRQQLAPALALAAFALLAPGRAASAQIISTMVPTQRTTTPTAGGATLTHEGGNVGLHFMGGFTNWEFGAEQDIRDNAEASGGVVTGGRQGFILAGDLAVAAGRNGSVGFGGWFNKVRALTVTYPGTAQFYGVSDSGAMTVSSFYGNFFYKRLGAQIGVVPFRFKETTVSESGAMISDDFNQNDTEVFMVGRVGSTNPRVNQWSVTVGGGLYRYGSREASAVYGDPASPAGNAFSIFANASVELLKGLLLDTSFWYTGADQNYDQFSTIGNSSQARFTIGAGWQF